MSRSIVPCRRFAAGIFILSTTLVAAGCGGSDAPSLDVSVTVDMPDSVPLDEPLHVTYTWAAASEFEAPMDDYRVFVHAKDSQGNVLFQDDHYPTEPTSQWAAGQVQTYDRWLYVPKGIEVENIDFEVGLYSGETRVLLRGEAGTWTNAVAAHGLEVRLDDMSGIPAYFEGWHVSENDAPGERTWRWSEGLARAAFTNPRQDSVLHLRAHGPFDEVGAQVLVLRIGETEIARIDVGSAAEFNERVEIPALAMGDDDWVELTLEITPVFMPKELDAKSMDERALGLQVFSLYLSSS